MTSPFLDVAFEGLEMQPDHVTSFGEPLTATVRFSNRGAGPARGVGVEFISSDDAFVALPASASASVGERDVELATFDAHDRMVSLPDVPAGETVVVRVPMKPSRPLRDGSRIGVQAVLSADGERHASNIAYIIVRSQARLSARASLEALGDNVARATVEIRAIGDAGAEHLWLTQAVPPGCVAESVDAPGTLYDGRRIPVRDVLIPGDDGSTIEVAYRVTIVEPQMQATIELPPITIGAANAEPVETDRVRAFVATPVITSPVITGLEVPLVAGTPRRVAVSVHNDGLVRSGSINVRLDLPHPLRILDDTHGISVTSARSGEQCFRGWSLPALHSGESAQFQCVVVAAGGAFAGTAYATAIVQAVPDRESTEDLVCSTECAVHAAPRFRLRATIPNHAHAGEAKPIEIQVDNVGDAWGSAAVLVNGDRYAIADIGPGSTASVVATVQIPFDAADGSSLPITIVDEASGECPIQGAVVVRAVPYFDRAASAISCDGTLRPGETLPLRLVIRNAGSGMATGVAAHLSAAPASHLELAELVEIGDIPAGHTRDVSVDLRLLQFVERNAPVHVDAAFVSTNGARFACGTVIATASEPAITGRLTINDVERVECEAGDLVLCMLVVHNAGPGHARDVRVLGEPLVGLTIVPGSLRVAGLGSGYVDDVFGPDGAVLGSLLPDVELTVSWAMFVDARAVGHELRPVVRILNDEDEAFVVTSSSAVIASGKAQLVPARTDAGAGALRLPGPLKALVSPSTADTESAPAEPQPEPEASIAAPAGPGTSPYAPAEIPNMEHAAAAPVDGAVSSAFVPAAPAAAEPDVVAAVPPPDPDDMAARVRTLLNVPGSAHAETPPAAIEEPEAPRADEVLDEVLELAEREPGPVEEAPTAGNEAAVTAAEEPHRELPDAEPPRFKATDLEDADGAADDDAIPPIVDAGGVAIHAVVVEMDVTRERVARIEQYLRQAASRGLATHLFAIRAFFPDRALSRNATLLPEALACVRDELKGLLDRLLLRLQLRSYTMKASDVDSLGLSDALLAIAEELSGAEDVSYATAPQIAYAAIDVSLFESRKREIGTVTAGDALPYYLLAQLLPQRAENDDLSWALIEYRATMLDALSMLEGAGAAAFERALHAPAPLDLDEKLERVLMALSRSLPMAIPA